MLGRRFAFHRAVGDAGAVAVSEGVPDVAAAAVCEFGAVGWKLSIGSVRLWWTWMTVRCRPGLRAGAVQRPQVRPRSGDRLQHASCACQSSCNLTEGGSPKTVVGSRRAAGALVTSAAVALELV